MTEKSTIKPTPQPNKPVLRVDHFPLRAAVWANKTNEGESFYSITFERAYKKDDQWRSSHNFSRSDLLGIAKLVDAVDTALRDLINADYAQAQQGEDA